MNLWQIWNVETGEAVSGALTYTEAILKRNAMWRETPTNKLDIRIYMPNR